MRLVSFQLSDGTQSYGVMEGDAIRAADGWQSWISSWATWSWSAFQGALIAGGTAGVAWLRRRFIDPAETVSPKREALV